MQKIYDIIDELYTELTKSVEIKKENFHEKLMLLNDLISTSLKDISIDNSRFDNLVIKKPEDRIKELDYQLETLSSGPEMLVEAVRLGEDKMRLFLKKYNIGFLKNITLNRSGMFVVEIPCLITTHTSSHSKDYSKKIEFEYQMDLLKSMGVEIEKSALSGSNGLVILSTEKSINALTKLIGDIGGVGINFDVRFFKGQMAIRHINFRISPENLFKYDEEPMKVILSTSEILNPDELLSLAHEFKELKSTLISYDDKDLIGVKESCRNIILHTFSTICKIVNLETSISKSVQSAYEESKRLQEIIKEKEDTIKKMIDPDLVKELSEKVMSSLEKFAAEEICFTCSEIEVSHDLKATLNFNPCGYSLCSHCDDVEDISEEKLKTTFECYDGTFDEENLVILNTKDNLDKLNLIIVSKYDGARIDSVEVGFKHFVGYYIKKISITFSKLNIF